ncbi:hypothetical protein L2K70_18305 [Nocardioides KLBMP 9356]|uniref:Tat pathway signal sequence domain protein n=1 Tax=Nocardioides potassii TaxID=2911371 RepID=A0ABS9HHG9_9ACTN|nr:hypothetical protein [Nocardioides potassii]MCF6379568.1 hypothetical protein [Nocardioides potassii]
MTIRERRDLPIVDRVGGTVVSRRTVTRGLAWTTPAVAVAAAAPAFAVSAGTVTFTPLGVACKLPGASCQKSTGVTKGYVVRVRVCSTFDYPVTITVRDASVSLGGAPDQLFQVGLGDASESCAFVTTGTVSDPQAGEQDDVTLTFSQAGCCVVDFALQGEPNSDNTTISGTAPYTYVVPGHEGETNGTGGGTFALTASSTPPCDKCQPPAAP